MSLSRVLVIVGIAGATGALGLAVGLGVPRSHEARAPSTDERVAAALTKLDKRLTALQSANDALRFQLAARDEARPEIAAAATPSEAPQAEQPVDPTAGATPSADPVVAFEALEQGQALLDRAIARGQWSTEDRENLHRLLANTDGSGTSELLTALVTAINSDQLRPVP